MVGLGSWVLDSVGGRVGGKVEGAARGVARLGEKPCALNTEREEAKEQPIHPGIRISRGEAKLTIMGFKDVPGIASAILGPISDANIEVDMIVQNVAADMSTDFTFTVRRDDYEEAKQILENIAKSIDAREVSGDNKIAKLSLVGVGMRSHAGVASTMFKVLADESINIQMISTSEIKISVVLAEKYLELAARALHSAFGLSEEA